MKYREGSNGENQQNLKFVLWNINKIDKSSAWLRQIDDQILKSGVKEEAWVLALQKQKRYYMKKKISMAINLMKMHHMILFLMILCLLKILKIFT